MPQTWKLRDFLVVWLGGLAGSYVGIMIARASGMDFASAAIATMTGQFAGTTLFLWFVARGKQDRSVGLSAETKDLGYVLLGMLLQYGTVLLLNPLARYLFPDGSPPQEIADVIQSAETPVYLKLYLFAAIVLIAPLVEEIVFRGVLLRALLPRGTWFAILISAFIFTLVHVPGLDPERMVPAAILALPRLFGLGVLLGWLTVRKGRLGPAIFLHSGWNFLAAVVLLLPPEFFDQLDP